MSKDTQVVNHLVLIKLIAILALIFGCLNGSAQPSPSTSKICADVVKYSLENTADVASPTADKSKLQMTYAIQHPAVTKNQTVVLQNLSCPDVVVKLAPEDAIAEFKATFSADVFLTLTHVQISVPCRVYPSDSYEVVIKGIEDESVSFTAAATVVDGCSAIIKQPIGMHFAAHKAYIIAVIPNEYFKRLPKSFPPPFPMATAP